MGSADHRIQSANQRIGHGRLAHVFLRAMGETPIPRLEIQMSNRVEELVEKVDATRTGFFQKDFLQTWKHSTDELRAVLNAAEALEQLYKQNISCRVFNGGIAVSNF